MPADATLADAIGVLVTPRSRATRSAGAAAIHIFFVTVPKEIIAGRRNAYARSAVDTLAVLVLRARASIPAGAAAVPRTEHAEAGVSTAIDIGLSAIANAVVAERRVPWRRATEEATGVMVAEKLRIAEVEVEIEASAAQ